jgi:hypothetical protein
VVNFPPLSSHLFPEIFDALRLMGHYNHVDLVFHLTNLGSILGLLTHPKSLSKFMISGIQVIHNSKYRIIQVSRSKKSSTPQSLFGCHGNPRSGPGFVG